MAVAIAQKLLGKLDLKLKYIGRLGKRGDRASVYKYVPPDDEQDVIFYQWLNRDELSFVESVSVTNNIDRSTQVTDTTPQNPQFLNPVEPSGAATLWKGLKLKLRQGLENAGRFYTEAVNFLGDAVGVADGEPFWNGCLGQWQVLVNFADGCKFVGCDWLVAVN